MVPSGSTRSRGASGDMHGRGGRQRPRPDACGDVHLGLLGEGEPLLANERVDTGAAAACFSRPADARL